MYTITYYDAEAGSVFSTFDSLDGFVDLLRSGVNLRAVFGVPSVGSDPHYRILVDGNEVEDLGLWSFTGLDSSADPRTLEVDGIPLLVNASRSGPGLFVYDVNPFSYDNLRPYLFRSATGLLGRFRSVVDANFDELVGERWCRDTFWWGGKQVYRRKMLEVYREVTCVFFSFELMFSRSLLIREIRVMMGLPEVILSPRDENVLHSGLQEVIDSDSVLHTSVRILSKNNQSLCHTEGVGIDGLVKICERFRLDFHVLTEFYSGQISTVLGFFKSHGITDFLVDKAHTRDVMGLTKMGLPQVQYSYYGSSAHPDGTFSVPLVFVASQNSSGPHLELLCDVGQCRLIHSMVLSNRFELGSTVLYVCDGEVKQTDEWDSFVARGTYIGDDEEMFMEPMYVCPGGVECFPCDDIFARKFVSTPTELCEFVDDLCGAHGTSLSSLVDDHTFVFYPTAFMKITEVVDDQLLSRLGMPPILSMSILLDCLLVAEPGTSWTIDLSSVRLCVSNVANMLSDVYVRRELAYRQYIHECGVARRSVDKANENVRMMRQTYARESMSVLRTCVFKFNLTLSSGVVVRLCTGMKCDDTLLDEVVRAHLEKRIPSMLVHHLYVNGLEKVDKEVERLKNAEENGAEASVVANLRKRVSNGHDYAAWLTKSLAKCNLLVDTMYHDRWVTKFGRRCLIFKGSSVLDRVRVIDNPLVEVGRLYTPTEFDSSFAPVSCDATSYKGEDMYLVDQSRQYVMVGMGCGNMTRPLDLLGMWPQFMTERNPTLQPIKWPVVSYFIDCGTIVFNPADVNLVALRSFCLPIVSHGSRLIQLISSTTVAMNITSVDLISWTIDVVEHRRAAGCTLPAFEIAKTFQDQLHIKEGYFSFDLVTRQSLWNRVGGFSGELARFDDYGRGFLEEPGLYYKVSSEMRYRLVVPNNCVLFDENVTPSENFDPFRVNPELMSVLEKFVYTDVLVTSVMQSLSIFALFSRTILSLNRVYDESDGRVTRDSLKIHTNSSIGKCRMSRTRGIRYNVISYVTLAERHEKDGIIACRSVPTTRALLSPLPNSGKVCVNIVGIRRRFVRMAPEGIRNYIVSTSGRIIEKIAMGVTDSACYRIRTDSIMVKGSAANLAREMFIRYVGPPDNVADGKLLIPGYARGFTITPVSASDVRKNPLYREVYLKLSTIDVRAGIYQGLPSFRRAPYLRQLLGLFQGVTLHNSVLMWEYYKKFSYYHELIPYDGCKTAKSFSRYITVHLDDEHVANFQKAFDRYEAKMVASLGNVLITGGPGNGKTYTIKNVARYYRETNGDTHDKIISVAPFHAIANTFRSVADETYTAHAFVGCGLSFSDVLKNPYDCMYRRGDMRRREGPYSSPVCLTIFDELQSVGKEMEEVLKVIRTIGETIILSGDAHQMPTVTGDGVDLTGSAVRYITNGMTYIKDVEYRNTGLLYGAVKRYVREGHMMGYLDPAVCDYFTGESADDVLRAKLQVIAEDLIKNGYSSTTIVCQSYNIAAICIYTVLRLFGLSNPDIDCALTHVSGSSFLVSSVSVPNVDDGIQDELRVSKRYFSRLLPGDAHAQRMFGIPLLMVKGLRYVVVRAHVPKYTVYGEQQDRLHQTSILRYSRMSIEWVKLKVDAGQTIDKLVRLFEFDVIVDDSVDRSVVLTSYEVCTYIMYPFVAQRVSLIGLTLDKVVVLQVASTTKNPLVPYARTYEPLKYTIEQTWDKYGKHCIRTRLYRQLHVILTRVKTGDRTVVLDVVKDDVFYRSLNYHVISGQGCNGYMSLFSVNDRIDLDKREEMGMLIRKMKTAITYRHRSIIGQASPCVVGTECDDVLLFPLSRLSTIGITKEMILGALFAGCATPHLCPAKRRIL